MSERAQPKRWRCLSTGCNPVLDEAAAAAHRESTGHRVARWPRRSAEGQRRAAVRNRTGYYDQYNAGAKAPEARGYSHRGGRIAHAGGPLAEGEDGEDYWGDSTG